MKRNTIYALLILLFFCACRQERVYSYSEALDFKAVSSEQEKYIDKVGTTKGVFEYYGCTVLNAPSVNSQASLRQEDGSWISWKKSKKQRVIYIATFLGIKMAGA